MARKLLTVLAMLALTGCDVGPADGTGTQVVDETEAAQDDPGVEPDPEAEPDEAALGTRSNPVPHGTQVEIGDEWHVAVLTVTGDAGEQVRAANEFNDPPGEGRQYVMATVRAVYAGDESGTPWIDLGIRYVAADGNTYGTAMDDSCGVIPGDLTDVGEQFPGATAEGNVCWSVPAAHVAGGAIIVEAQWTFSDTRVFFAGA